MGSPVDLVERNALYERIVETTSEGVWLIDAASHTAFVNESMARMLGYERSELAGRSLFDLMDDECRADAAARVEERKLGVAETHEFQFRRKDGSRLWTRMACNPMLDEAGGYAGALALVTDLTRERATEARFRALIEASQDLLLLSDAGGRFTFASPSVLAILGYTPEELREHHPIELIHPDDQAVAGAALASSAPGVTTERVEFRVRHRDGSWRTFSANGCNLLDNPDVRAMVMNARDVTNERKLEEQLRQSQRLESVGRLAGGVAHDFNNLLTTILGAAEFLEEDAGLSDSARSDVQEIKRASERASELTGQLLAFARRRILRPENVGIGQILLRQERFLRRVIGEAIEVVTHCPEEEWQVFVDAAQLEQIIVNLAVNARDAMKSGGRLTFEVQNVELDEAFASTHGDVKPGAYVLLTVSDTGEGIAAEALPHIFEPFYTTKSVGAGTGLGLASVYGIIRQSEGYVWVYSEPGVGTTFKIYLPRTREGGPSLEAPPAPAIVRGSERVLVVEDDETVRQMLVRALESAGYAVHAEATPAGGLAWARAQRGGLELLLTDVVMPGMSGKQLATELVREFPLVRVLFVSGYTENTIVHRGVLEAGVEFLAKPFSPTSVRARVREVLDRK